MKDKTRKSHRSQTGVFLPVVDYVTSWQCKRTKQIFRKIHLHQICSIINISLMNCFAKISDGFTKLTPSILCILFMCITMFSISKAMSALPVGFAYSTYSGLTVTGVVLFAMLKYNQIPNIYGTIGIILIIVGVVMVNYLGKLN